MTGLDCYQITPEFLVPRTWGNRDPIDFYLLCRETGCPVASEETQGCHLWGAGGVRQTDVDMALRHSGTLREASFCRIVYLLQDRKGPGLAQGDLKQHFHPEGLTQVVTTSCRSLLSWKQGRDAPNLFRCILKVLHELHLLQALDKLRGNTSQNLGEVFPSGVSCNAPGDEFGRHLWEAN